MKSSVESIAEGAASLSRKKKKPQETTTKTNNCVVFSAQFKLKPSHKECKVWVGG